MKRLCVNLAKIVNNGRAVDSEETHLVVIIIIVVITSIINIFIIIISISIIIRLSKTAKE